MSLPRDDRAQLGDMMERHSLGAILAEMATIYRERTKDVDARTEEWATEWARHGVTDDLLEEATAAIRTARAHVLRLVCESAGLALAALL